MDLRLALQALRAIQQLRQHEGWSRAQLQAHQAQGLRRLREHAYTHSPFYQRFHRGLFHRPLRELPVLTKATLMEHFDELATNPAIRLEAVRALAAERRPDRRYLDRYWLLATSGSSGQPGFFLFSEPEWLIVLASFARCLEWSGAGIIRLGRRKLATIASTSPWHMSAQVTGAAPAWWMPALRLPATEPMDRLVQQLNAWQPDVLIAYASVFRLLADEQLAGRLHIRPGYAFASAEVLTDETRQRSRLAWGAEPFNQYGATETGDLAAEHGACRRMHLFEDLVLTEVVDEDNQPVPPGTWGAKVLVTTLFSRTQPLIRYELSDRLRLAAEPCACGHLFGVVDAIQGRVEDTLDLPALAGGRVLLDPLVFNHVMDIQPISGWQVAQQADDSLAVLVCGPRPGFDGEALAGQLRQALAEHGARVPPVQVRIVPAIPPAASGKTPLIKRHEPAKT
jgi:phenylacetate-CoA ligase